MIRIAKEHILALIDTRGEVIRTISQRRGDIIINVTNTEGTPRKYHISNISDGIAINEIEIEGYGKTLEEVNKDLI